MLLCNTLKWVVPFLIFNVDHVFGRSLVPIRPGGNGGVKKRQQPADMDLRHVETFLWGDADESNIAIANLTLYMPGDTEGVLAMEHFDGMLTETKCSNGSIEMTFQDDATFLYAQKTWDWVNGAENHSFVMVAGPGDCGNNTDRIPYVISTLQYDEVANKATLAAVQMDWSKVAHSYDLKVGSIGKGPSGAGVQGRDIDKETSIDFNHDLPFSFAIGVGNLEGRIACTNCSTTGQFDVEFTVSQKFLVPTGASMKLSPKGVAAIGQIKLSGSGSITDSLTKTFDIVSIPISALNIPGILEFGPFFTVAVGAELSAISLTAGITSGVKGTLSDDAILEIDLLNPEKNSFSGWEPEVEMIDIKVDASISGGVAVFLQPSLELKAEALGTGFELGLNMRIPNLNARLSAIASPQGACANQPADQPKKTLGVNIAANIGAALNIKALRSGSEDPLFTLQLAAIDKPLASVCFPFGPEVAARSVGHPHSRRMITPA